MLDRIEWLLFRLRAIILLVLVVATAGAAWKASSLKFDSDIEKQLPLAHPFIRTALEYRDKIFGINNVQIVVESRTGDIWNPQFLKTLHDITEEAFYLPGVWRPSVTSMWTPNTQVYETTEGGVDSHNLIPGTVVPEHMTAADVARIRADAFKGGLRGRLFSLDSKSAMIQVSIQDTVGTTDKKTDLFVVADLLESQIRHKYENDRITIRIIGFTKFIGDIGREARDFLLFVGIAVVLSGLALWYYARSFALTALTILCSGASVVWLLALVEYFKIGLSPLGLIVPFLVYAIGVSHGVQQLNLFLVATTRSHTAMESAQRSFRRLLLPGFFSLMTVLAGFAAILIVPIPFVRELAVIACIGIALKLVSNLIMLPLALSYVHLDAKQVAHQKVLLDGRQKFMAALSMGAHPAPAVLVLVLALALTGYAIAQARTVSIGHLTSGAPELWSSARYNADASAISAGFDLNLDTFVVVSVTPVDGCVSYAVMALIERFGVEMKRVPGVKSVVSLPEVSRFLYSIVQEGNLKWRVLPKATDTLVLVTGAVSDTTGLRNSDCTLMPIAVNLTDHRDDTLRRVSSAAQAFVAANKMPGTTFRLATGNGGILAAVNDTVRDARLVALGFVFAVISILIFAAFRDWRAVFCCVVPIMIATALGLWLMSWLEIGLTISTLPVLVLAVGIGVDYGIYLYERIETHLREGLTMENAFVLSMREEGTAVVFTALTLAIGVGCWAFSDPGKSPCRLSTPSSAGRSIIGDLGSKTCSENLIAVCRGMHLSAQRQHSLTPNSASTSRVPLTIA